MDVGCHHICGREQTPTVVGATARHNRVVPCDREVVWLQSPRLPAVARLVTVTAHTAWPTTITDVLLHSLEPPLLLFASIPMPPRTMPSRKAKRSTTTQDGRTVTTAKPARRAAKPRRIKASEAKEDNDSGRLKGMLDMPTDIIFEVRHGHFAQCLIRHRTKYIVQILRQLHPRTVLNLSLTSKSLHSYLMNKDSAPIWRVCLRNVPDLPPCPQNIIEPVYTAFMFGSHCMVSLTC